MYVLVMHEYIIGHTFCLQLVSYKTKKGISMTDPEETTHDVGFLVELAAMEVGGLQIDSPELAAIRERNRVNNHELPKPTVLKHLVELQTFLLEHEGERFSQAELATALGLKTTSQGYVSTLLNTYGAYFQRENGFIKPLALPQAYTDEYVKMMHGGPTSTQRQQKVVEPMEKLLQEILAELKAINQTLKDNGTATSPVETKPTARKTATTKTATAKASEPEPINSKLREYMEPRLLNYLMNEWLPDIDDLRAWPGNLSNIKSWGKDPSWAKENEDKNIYIKILFRCIEMLDNDPIKYRAAMQALESIKTSVEKMPPDITRWPYIAPSVVTLMMDRDVIKTKFDHVIEPGSGHMLLMFILRCMQLIEAEGLTELAMDYVTTNLMEAIQ